MTTRKADKQARRDVTQSEDAMNLDTLEEELKQLLGMKDSLFQGDKILFDKVNNLNAVMVAWKPLMRKPQFCSEAELF